MHRARLVNDGFGASLFYIYKHCEWGEGTMSASCALDGACSYLMSEEEDETTTFVNKMKALVCARIKLEHGGASRCASYGVMMGEEYRVEYNSLKRKLPTFEKKYNDQMQIGWAWESFYPCFMEGVEGILPGPIHALAGEFIGATAQQLAVSSSCKTVGRNKGVDYFRLRDLCMYSFLHVPATEFDERMRAYIIGMLVRVGASDAAYYDQFMEGINSVTLERNSREMFAVALGVFNDESSKFRREIMYVNFGICGNLKSFESRFNQTCVVMVIWRYELKFGAEENRFSMELLNAGIHIGLLLCLFDASDASPLKVVNINEKEIETGTSFQGKVLVLFKNIVNWLKYGKNFVALWKEYAKMNKVVSELVVRESEEGSDENNLAEFTFQYNSVDRFFILLSRSASAGNLSVLLRDTKKPDASAGFEYDPGLSFFRFMRIFLSTVKEWSSA